MHISIEHYYPPNRIPIIMNPSDTISSLKGRIMDEFLLPVDEMNNCLLIVDGRDPLDGDPIPFLYDAKDLFEADDSTTLRDLGIKDDDCLRLGYKQPFIIEAIFHPSMRGHKITVDCKDTIQSLRENIRSATGKPLNRHNFPLILLTKWAKERTLLSMGFYNIHPIRWNEHQLYLNPLNTRPFVSEYDTTHGFSFKSAPEATRVENEEEEDEELEEVRSSIYLHTFRSTETISEEDNPNDPKVQIDVEIPNMSYQFPIHAKLESTVSMLKDAIIALCKSSLEVHFPDYILNGRFELFYDNQRMQNSLHPSFYDVDKGSLLQLYYETSFHIEVIFSDRHYSVYVRCFDTVARLKEKVEHVTGLLKKYQNLNYNGRCLDSNKTKLVYYGIDGLGDKSCSIPIHLNSVPHSKEEEEESEDEEEKKNKKRREEYEGLCVDVKFMEELNKGIVDTDYFTTTPGIEEEQMDLLDPELAFVRFIPVNEPPQDVDYVAKDSGDTTSPQPEQRKLEADAEGQQNRRKHKLPRRGYTNSRGGGRRAYPNGGRGGGRGGRGGKNYQNMPKTSTRRRGITRGTISTTRGGRSRGSSMYDDY